MLQRFKRQKKGFMNPIGVLMSILALFLAYTFFTMFFGGTSSAKSEVSIAKLELSNDIDTMTLLNSPVGDKDIADLIGEAYMTCDWITMGLATQRVCDWSKVQAQLTNVLYEYIGKDINWRLSTDDYTEIETGRIFWKNRIFESEAWVALPYNPDKKIVKIKLEVVSKK